MMRLNRLVFATAVVGFAVSALAAERKYLACGWEFNGFDVDGLLCNADRLDRTPIDGVEIFLNAVKRADGTTMTSRGIVEEPEWTKDELRPLIPKFRELLKHRSFRESLLHTYRAPLKRISWLDDAAWARIGHNMRVAAWFARESGFRGLAFDPEDYHNQKQYQRLASEPPYPELAKIARRRGREAFGGVFAEFPDVRIFSTWLLTLSRSYMGGSGDLRAVAANRDDVWPHFVDGLYDVLSPGATIVDGNEHAYRFEAENYDFIRTACSLRSSLVNLLAPENREKYRRQTQVSLGLYMDSFVNPEGNSYYSGPVFGSRLRHFELNLGQAVAATDEIVWFESEFHGFCTWGKHVKNHTKTSGEQVHPKVALQSWDDCLPGLNAAMAAIKDPHAAARVGARKLAAGKIKAINANVACVGTDPKRPPEPYWMWQDTRFSHGTCGSDATTGDGDSSSLVVEGVSQGSVLVKMGELKVSPGDKFGFALSVKGRGVSAVVNWLRGGKWDFNIPAVPIPIETGDEKAWRRGAGGIVVPMGADGFGLQIQCLLEPGEKAWIDNVAIFRMGEDVSGYFVDNKQRKDGK